MAIKRRDLFKYIGGCLAGFTITKEKNQLIPESTNQKENIIEKIKNGNGFNVIESDRLSYHTGDFGNGIEIRSYIRDKH